MCVRGRVNEGREIRESVDENIKACEKNEDM